MRRESLKIIVACCIAAAWTVSPGLADAYTTWCGEHNDGVGEYRINPNFSDACAGTGTQQIAAIQAGADEWTYEAEACFDWQYEGTTTKTSVNLYDGVNAVFASSQSGGGALAATFCDGSSVDHGFDIAFYDSGITWCLSASGGTDIRAVATHELGHALGLGHSTTNGATMYPYYSGISDRSIEADDIAGIQHVYGYCPNCWDDDGDGYDDDACGGTDCNDSNSSIHPCATEICGNGTDEDCSDGARACGGFQETESNDTPGSAENLGTILASETVKGNICIADNNSSWYDGDVDYFRFTTPDAGYNPLLEASLAWSGSGNFDLWLYQSDGTTPIVYATSILNPEVLSMELSPDTQYVIMAAGWSGEDSDYTLELSFGECWDVDGDNYSDDACGGSDCDDGNASVNPGADENCGNGIDDDCDGLVDDDDLDCCDDADGDQYLDDACGGDDCDDTDPDVNPSVPESIAAGNCLDGADNDCDGLVDIADPGCCDDADGDNYDDDACGGDDCDDTDADVNPGADEDCSNGIDDDCDTLVDDNDDDCTCTDVDGDGYGFPASEYCTYPAMDCNDSNAQINPGMAEIQGNGIDDDCNPATPDEPGGTCFLFATLR